jgi:hypothetical protein
MMKRLNLILQPIRYHVDKLEQLVDDPLAAAKIQGAIVYQVNILQRLAAFAASSVSLTTFPRRQLLFSLIGVG